MTDERFEVRRASPQEARRTREFLGQTFHDRVAWVAAREILQELLDGSWTRDGEDTATVPLEVIERARRFLSRHPKPKIAPRKPERLDLGEVEASERDPSP